MNSENLTQVCAVVLLKDNDTALLQLRDDRIGLRAANEWVFPGGHGDPGETTIETALREMKEETGYVCSNLKPLCRIYYDSDKGYDPVDLHVFWDLYDGEQKLICGEGQKIEFVDRSAVMDLNISPYQIRIWNLAWDEYSNSKSKRVLC